MTHLGPTIHLKGELRCREDLTVDGRVEGPVLCEDGALVVGPSGHVIGDVVARDVTVHGHVAGQIVATDVVEVRAHATVHGQVVSRRFLLDESARFDGRVEPQHLDAALKVAEYRRQQRDEASAGRPGGSAATPPG